MQMPPKTTEASFLFVFNEDGEIAQHGEEFAVNLKDLISLLGSYMLRGENQPLVLVFSSPMIFFKINKIIKN